MPTEREKIFFHEGLGFDARSQLTKAGTLRVALNVLCNEDGIVRAHNTKMTNTTVGAGASKGTSNWESPRIFNFKAINTTKLYGVTGIFRFRDRLMVMDQTSANVGRLLQRSATSDGDFTAMHTGMTTDKAPIFKVYKDFVMIRDGTNVNMMDASGNCYNAIMANPTAGPSGAAGAGGNPSGVYKLYYTYFITFPNGMTYETGLSPASADVTVTSQQISWTGIGTMTSPARGTSTAPTIIRRLYRGPGTGGSLAEVYYVGQIADNTTTTYTDNVSDATLQGQGTCDSEDYGPLTTGHFHEFHFGRYYWIDKTNDYKLYYSEPAAGTSAATNAVILPIGTPTTNWIDIRVAGVGDQKPTGLIDIGGYLYIALEHTWLKKYGETPSSWSLKKTYAQHGIIAPHTLDYCPQAGGVIYLTKTPDGRLGLAIFDGSSSEMITSPKFDGFFQTFTSDYYTWSYLKDYTWGKMIGNYYYLNLRTVTVSGGTPYHSTKTLCFDFTRFPDLRLTQITNVDLNYGRDGPICVTQGNTDTRPFMVYYGQFHYTSDVYTYVYRSTLYSDDELNNYATLVNSPEVYVMTHRLTGGDPARLKRLKRLKYSLRNYDYLNKKLSLMILLNYDTNRGAPPDDLDAVNYYTGYSNGLLTPDFDAIKISGDGDYYQVFDAFPPTAVCYDYTIFVSSSTTYGADSDIQDIEIYGPWEMEFDYIE